MYWIVICWLVRFGFGWNGVCRGIGGSGNLGSVVYVWKCLLDDS